jgi:hypothetical protein
MIFKRFEVEDLGFQHECQILPWTYLQHAKEDRYRLVPRSGVRHFVQWEDWYLGLGFKYFVRVGFVVEETSQTTSRFSVNSHPGSRLSVEQFAGRATVSSRLRRMSMSLFQLDSADSRPSVQRWWQRLKRPNNRWYSLIPTSLIRVILCSSSRSSRLHFRDVSLPQIEFQYRNASALFGSTLYFAKHGLRCARFRTCFKVISPTLPWYQIFHQLNFGKWG